MRIIDADKAREEATIDLVVHHLDRQPTLDYKDFVPQGEWNYRKPKSGAGVDIFCTHCDIPLESPYKKSNYCPNCGARMVSK